jgi:hypothetical protein
MTLKNVFAVSGVPSANHHEVPPVWAGRPLLSVLPRPPRGRRRSRHSSAWATLVAHPGRPLTIQARAGSRPLSPLPSPADRPAPPPGPLTLAAGECEPTSRPGRRRKRWPARPARQGFGLLSSMVSKGARTTRHLLAGIEPAGRPPAAVAMAASVSDEKRRRRVAHGDHDRVFGRF